MEKKVLLEKYELVKEIARGGMGTIHEALHRGLNRHVAIKILHEQYAGDSSFLERFQAEARAMARLDHRNIIRVFDVEQDEGTHFIVMEYFRGQDLKQTIHEEKQLTELKAASVALQVAHALSYAHKHGIIHRDIKPANIMIDAQGLVKLADFGIAASANETALTQVGTVIGTPEYMSPEQARGGDLDGRCDLYALGMVLYELISGKTAFHGVSGVAILGKLIYEKEPIPLQFQDGNNAALERLIRNLLSKDRNKRLRDANALIPALEKIITALEAPQGTSTRNRPPQDSSKTNSATSKDIKTDTSTPGTPQPLVATKIEASPSKKKTEPELKTKSVYDTGPRPQSQKKRSRAPLLAVVLFLLVSGVVMMALSDKPLYFSLAKNDSVVLQEEIKKIRTKLLHSQQEAAAVESNAKAQPLLSQAEQLKQNAATQFNKAQRLIDNSDFREAKVILSRALALFKQADNRVSEANKEARENRKKTDAEQLEAELQQLEEEHQAQQAAQEKRQKIEKELQIERQKLRREKRVTKKTKDHKKKAASTRRTQKRPSSKPVQLAGLSRPQKMQPSETIDQLGEKLSILISAFESKDLNRLQKLSSMSQQRRLFFEQLFARYNTISVSVTDLAILDKQAEAIVSITSLRDKNGKRISPQTQWKDARLLIRKKHGKWEKARWAAKK